MAALLALVSSLMWGVGDFVGGLASRRASPLQVVVVSTPVGWLLVLPVAVLLGGDAAGSAWVGIVGGAAGSLGILALYAGLTLGPMGVVSPLSAVLGAAIPVVAGLALGERPAPAAYAGMLLAAVAIVTVGLEPRAPTDDAGHQRLTRRALALSVMAGAGFGLFFVFMGLAPDGAGLWPVVFARGTASVLMIVVALAVRLRSGTAMAPRGRAVLLLCVAVGVLDVSANSLYVVAVQQPGGLLAVISVLGSLYPAATVLLARFVLAERLRPLQKVGMVTALAASALLAIGA